MLILSGPEFFSLAVMWLLRGVIFGRRLILLHASLLVWSGQHWAQVLAMLVGRSIKQAGRRWGAQSRPLSDYAVKAANKTRRATCKLVGVVLTPAAYTLLLGLSAAGVAGAGLGATTTVVGTSVYNMVKRHKGEYAQIKSISDYVINGALIGSYVAMFAAASAALFPGGKYVESRPDWF